MLLLESFQAGLSWECVLNKRESFRLAYDNFDIEKEAPGPMVYTSDELIEAISNIDEEMEKCKDRIDIFNNKYINFEGPESCNKIFETVFDPQNDLK